MELHEYELALLPALLRTTDVAELAELSGLEPIKVSRALQWLSNKELVSLAYDKDDIITITQQGEDYARKGTPDKRALELLKNGPHNANQLAEQADISPQELGAVIGRLKKQNAINVRKTDTGMILEPLPEMQSAFEKEANLQDALATAVINKQEGKPFTFSDEQLQAFEQRRGTLEKQSKTHVTVTLRVSQEKIQQIIDQAPKEQAVGALTHELIKSKQFDKQFRSYRLNDAVPPVVGGRRHFTQEAKAYIRQLWLSLGFEEMQGNYVQSAFWDMDVLYTPQDHPARTMQDTFYLNHNEDLEKTELYGKVKATHENGGTTGSTGWRYPFSHDETSKLMLRTHSTVLSAQTLAKIKLGELPKKFFSIGKVFRNETLDWSHLCEFHQIEGIVVDENANFATLLAYLKQFFGKMGYPDVRMRPAYFPYTEPSAEVDVWHPERKVWVELGGCGIFRPEVVEPLLGKYVPVLAWGLGMERIVVEEFGFKDLRDIYANDIKQLQEAHQFMRYS